MSTPNTAKRGAWTLGDQAVSSLANFAFSFLVLRFMSLTDFGAFSLVYTLYSVAVAVVHGFICEPLAVRHSLDDRAAWGKVAAEATGAALAAGAALGGVLALAALALGGDLRGLLLVLAASLPALMLQETWRFAFFTAGSPSRAFWNDCIWALVQLPCIGILLAAGDARLQHLVLIWGGAGSIAGAMGCVQSGTMPNLRRAARFISDHRDLGGRFSAEMALNRGVSQLTLLLIGAIGGLSALGAVTGARTLYGPLNVLFLSAVSFGVPEGVRLRQSSSEAFRRMVGVVGIVLGGAALVIAAVLFLLPSWAGQALVQENWDVIRSCVIPIGIVTAAEGSRQAAYVGLRVLAAARASLRAQALAGPVWLAAGVTGVALGSGLGASWGLAGAGLLWTAVFWHALRQEVGDRVSGPEGCSG